MTTRGNERQRVVQRMAAGGTGSDNEWQRMATSDNKWKCNQRKTTSSTMNEKEWEQIRVTKREWF